MKVKISGITNKEDAQNAVSLGVEAISFIFEKNDPRSVTIEQAEEITAFLSPFISIVGRFTDEDRPLIESAIKRCNLNVLEFHGHESPSFCLGMPRKVIKAFDVFEVEDLSKVSRYQGIISGLLLDTEHTDRQEGEIIKFDWGIGIKAKEYDIPLIISGNIQVDNLKKITQLIKPYAIDVCEIVESELGKKDYNKMQEVINLAKTI
jgi:phosphoribosylanthranilate isomerase